MAEIMLRYGINPHQGTAKLYSEKKLPVKILNGEPSYTNILDALNSFQLVMELKKSLGLPSAASFKHVSPAGAAVYNPLSPELARSYFVEDLELSPLQLHTHALEEPIACPRSAIVPLLAILSILALPIC
ncbi:hypothetical protein [Cohnella faecalis]|nr:hypothetical protein [Cohnella faecalis]